MLINESRWRIHRTPKCAGAAITGLMLLASLGSCTRQQHLEQSSQVLARVNEQTITASQLQQAQLKAASDGATPASAKQTIDLLIEQELLMQKALEAKLDRDPAVMQAIEQARREILARAYAEREIFPKSEIAAFEKERYYKAHPELFEHRRLYRLDIFGIQTKDFSQALRDDLDDTRSSEKVSEVLGRHNANFDIRRISREAEQLPLEMLPQFAAADIGDVLIAPQPNGKTLLASVVGVDDDPISLEQAEPAIEQYLINERDARSLEIYVRKLRAEANISYVEANISVPDAARIAPSEYIKKGLDGLH